MVKARRKARNPRASWLVTGGKACAAILHHGQTAYLQPVKAGDHPKRYSAGQRLAVKPFVPGATEAHVVLTSVQRLYVGEVDASTALKLGYANLMDFQDSWVEANDPEWFDRWMQDGATAAIGDRFENRWAKRKLVWLLRFRLDHTSAPRMLAATPSIYDPEKENAEGRDEDRGYTTSDSRSLADEMPALTDDEWARHIGPQSSFREWDRLRTQRREREGQPLRDRLTAATAAARSKGFDIRDETRRCERALDQGKTEKAREQIALIERRVFPVAA